MSDEEVGIIQETITQLLVFAITFAIIGAILFLMMELLRYLLGIKTKTNLFGTKKSNKTQK